MLVSDHPPVHLTYCLNVHPGETWEENLEAIKTKAVRVRDRVAPGREFGLGLRLGNIAAGALSDSGALDRFRAFLEQNRFYVYTINGFPYGDFHSSPVKEKAYHPDWRSSERRDYTIGLSEILAELLPDGISGSISTVPGSYKEWIRSESDRAGMVRNLMQCVAHLSEIREKTGKDLHIGLEPEPDCFLETTDETVAFFDRELSQTGSRYLARLKGCGETEAGEMIARHIGVCFDTCHMSLQFESLPESINRLREKGIRISKIQISAALKTACTRKSLERLRDFCDPVYLHQVKARCEEKEIKSYGDLPEALVLGLADSRDGEQWRIHCHVPLYFQGDDTLESTSSGLTPDFFSFAIQSGCEHLEIETYTFNVLPKDLRTKGVVESVAAEYEWVIDRLPPESEDSIINPGRELYEI
jgi:sugar phosphate isomerase/epimerase